ncbi:MAG TPA: hypothetical protein VMW62_09170 [Chloroflexota bacterium]|nr:hypothetical protein [Chloroflexota bacterium]
MSERDNPDVGSIVVDLAIVGLILGIGVVGYNALANGLGNAAGLGAGTLLTGISGAVGNLAGGIGSGLLQAGQQAYPNEPQAPSGTPLPDQANAANDLTNLIPGQVWAKQQAQAAGQALSNALGGCQPWNLPCLLGVGSP